MKIVEMGMGSSSAIGKEGNKYVSSTDLAENGTLVWYSLLTVDQKDQHR